MNSVGKLPMAYIDNTPKYKSEAALGNARQILAKYLVKASIMEKSEIVFKPFEPLKHYSKFVAEIEGLIGGEQYTEATHKCIEFIDLCQDGNFKLHRLKLLSDV